MKNKIHKKIYAEKNSLPVLKIIESKQKSDDVINYLPDNEIIKISEELIERNQKVYAELAK